MNAFRLRIIIIISEIVCELMEIHKQGKTGKSWGFAGVRIVGKISRFLCTAWWHLHTRQTTSADQGSL